MKKLLFLALILMLGCASHKDFPSAIQVSEPATPANFKVTMPTAGEYFLDWSVGDSTAVSYYRVYILDPYAGPEEVDTTSASSFHYNFYIPVTDVVWGVSAISVENIESSIVYAWAPPQ
jgi:hypothetical protein